MKNKFTVLVLVLLLLFNISYISPKAYIYDGSKYVIFIDLYAFTLSVLNSTTNECVKCYPIAIGKPSTPSPIGVWQVKSKALMKDPFGGFWLGLNVPWDTFGIHGTNTPESIGSMASNGCIRMYNHNIRELFNIIDYDTIVVISGGANWRFSPYNRNIHPNDHGADVFYVQRILNALGYYDHPADGIYGYSLEIAILKYKKDFGLYEDNIIDEEFFKSIGCERFE